MNFKKLFSLILMLLFIFTLGACNKKDDNKNTEENNQTENNQTGEEITDEGSYEDPTFTIDPNEPKEITEYYKKVDNELRGEALVDSISKTINEGYVRYSYSSLNQYLAKTDADPNNPGKVICFYSRRSISGGWNKEHVWAKSHGFKEGGYDAYSDMHHLRPTITDINSARSNFDFDDVENHPGKTVKTTYGKDDHPIYGSKYIENLCFEPIDEAKGDVARMIFYMATKYHKGNGGNGLNLEVVESIPTSRTQGEGRIGRLSTLLKWHYQDPVDDFERTRNDKIYGYQKNRNPFIDRPDYVTLCYDTHAKANQAKVDNVVSEINKLPALGNITLTHEAQVNKVLALYNKLNGLEKALVTNHQKLVDAYNKIQELKGGNPVDPETPDTPVGNVLFKANLATSGITTSGYESDVTLSVNSKSFYVSQLYADGSEFRIGHNKNSFPVNAKFGLDANGSHLEMNFDLDNISSLKFNITNTYGTAENYYVYFQETGSSTYTKVKEGSIGVGNVQVNFDTPKNGRFAIVFTGSKVRVCIDNFEIYAPKSN